MTTSIFDDMIASKPEGEEETAGTEAEATAEAVEGTDTNTAEWPKTLTLPAGERPEGSVQVAEFADIVNKQLVSERVGQLLADGKSPIEAATEAIASQVNQASFYQAVKGQRNALPHYVVNYETAVTDAEGNPTGETKIETKTFVPVEVGLEWWKNRPTRGGGAARSSEEDIEKRLYRAGKKVADLKAAQDRLVKLTENVKRMQTQVDGYRERLEADGKTLDDATAAYEAQAEKDEAEKAIEG